MHNADAVVGSLPLVKIAMHLLSCFPRQLRLTETRGTRLPSQKAPQWPLVGEMAWLHCTDHYHHNNPTETSGKRWEIPEYCHHYFIRHRHITHIIHTAVAEKYAWE